MVKQPASLAIVGCALLLLTGSAVSPAQIASKPDERIRVFVGPNVHDGFIDVDQGILDSIADIKRELRSFRGMVIVKTSEEATIRLVVIARRVSGNSGHVATPIGTSAVLVPIDRHAIETVLRFGSHEKPLTSEDNGAGTWRGAAKQVAKDVAAWMNANMAAIANANR